MPPQPDRRHRGVSGALALQRKLVLHTRRGGRSDEEVDRSPAANAGNRQSTGSGAVLSTPSFLVTQRERGLLMLNRSGSHLRQHCVAYLALFVALGGTSMAASNALVPKNSVGTAQVINGSLLKTDFKSGQLPRGARGPAGPRGLAGAQGPAGPPGA